MKKILAFLILLALPDGVLHAQQAALYSQYMNNPYTFNPAIAGTFNYYQIRTNNRFQWVGLTDAPIYNSLSIYGPLEKYPMGVGGFITHDVVGPESMTTLNVGTAYYYPINPEIKISMGLTIGAMQYKMDYTQIETEQPNDYVIPEAIFSKILPDAKVGIYLYSSLFHVGFAANNLFNNKLKVGDQPTGLSKLKSHYFLTGGYIYPINRYYMLESTIVLRGVPGAPLQGELNAFGIYQQRFKLGMGFRTADAVSILLGYVHEKKIEIGYSYDIGISPIRRYHTGSHEIYLGYKFNAIKD